MSVDEAGYTMEGAMMYAKALGDDNQLHLDRLSLDTGSLHTSNLISSSIGPASKHP